MFEAKFLRGWQNGDVVSFKWECEKEGLGVDRIAFCHILDSVAPPSLGRGRRAGQFKLNNEDTKKYLNWTERL